MDIFIRKGVWGPDIFIRKFVLTYGYFYPEYSWVRIFLSVGTTVAGFRIFLSVSNDQFQIFLSVSNEQFRIFLSINEEDKGILGFLKVCRVPVTIDRVQEAIAC